MGINFNREPNLNLKTHRLTKPLENKIIDDKKTENNELVDLKNDNGEKCNSDNTVLWSDIDFKLIYAQNDIRLSEVNVHPADKLPVPALSAEEPSAGDTPSDNGGDNGGDNGSDNQQGHSYYWYIQNGYSHEEATRLSGLGNNDDDDDDDLDIDDDDDDDLDIDNDDDDDSTSKYELTQNGIDPGFGELVDGEFPHTTIPWANSLDDTSDGDGNGTGTGDGNGTGDGTGDGNVNGTDGTGDDEQTPENTDATENPDEAVITPQNGLIWYDEYGNEYTGTREDYDAWIAEHNGGSDPFTEEPEWHKAGFKTEEDYRLAHYTGITDPTVFYNMKEQGAFNNVTVPEDYNPNVPGNNDYLIGTTDDTGKIIAEVEVKRDANGAVLYEKRVYEDGSTRAIIYDSENNIAAIDETVINPDGSRTRTITELDSNGSVISVTEAVTRINSDGTETTRTMKKVNGEEYLLSVVVKSGDKIKYSRQYEYGSNGEIADQVKIYNNDGSCKVITTDQNGVVYIELYDSNGNITRGDSFYFKGVNLNDYMGYDGKINSGAFIEALINAGYEAYYFNNTEAENVFADLLYALANGSFVEWWNSVGLGSGGDGGTGAHAGNGVNDYGYGGTYGGGGIVSHGGDAGGLNPITSSFGNGSGGGDDWSNYGNNPGDREGTTSGPSAGGPPDSSTIDHAENCL